MYKLAASAVWLDVNPETEAYDGDNRMWVYDNLVTGSWYDFKIRARNVYGFGDFSPTSQIRASSFPSKPVSPVTTETIETVVRIRFSEPDTNGDPITGYNILIKQYDGVYSASSECD